MKLNKVSFNSKIITKPTEMFIKFLFIGFTFYTFGCSTIGGPPAKINYEQHNNNYPIDNPSIIFPKFIKAAQKDEFETTDEHRKRIQKIDGLDKEYCFLIKPEYIETIPFPDDNLYIVKTKGLSIGTTLYDKPTFKIGGEINQMTEQIMENAFGVKKQVKVCTGNDFYIHITNLSSLPSNIIMKDNAFYKNELGLCFRSPDKELLNRMKQKNLGLIIKLKVVYPENATKCYYVKSADLSSPYQFDFDVYILHTEVTGISVVSSYGSTVFASWSKN